MQESSTESSTGGRGSKVHASAFLLTGFPNQKNISNELRLRSLTRWVNALPRSSLGKDLE